MIDLLLYASLLLLVVGCWLKLVTWASKEVEPHDPAHRSEHMLDSIYDETTEGKR